MSQFWQLLGRKLGPHAVSRFYNNYAASWLVFFNRTQHAISRYEASLQLYQNDERAKHCLASLYAQKDQPYANLPKALQYFAELIAAHPLNASYPFNTAFVIQQQGQHPQACALFEQALAVDKNHDRAWYGLALSYMALDNWTAAQNALEHNTRLQPMSPYGWYQLAVAQAQQGHWEDAQRTGKHLMGFEPKFARGLLDDLKALKRATHRLTN